MEISSRHVYFRRFAGLGVVAALLATVFAPALAASQDPPGASPVFSTRSIDKVIVTERPVRVRLNGTAADLAKATPKQAKNSGSFFKTRTGLLVVAAMAAGTGYALYSASADRIRGSIR